MADTVIRVENVSKQYRLGEVGTGTLSHDLNRWWYKIRGKEDPYLKVGDTNDRAHKGGSDYVWSLRDISFDVKQGEVLGIIGKNGAGKSTLLKVLSQVTAPTTGQVKIKGRIASLLEVGTGFHPELTGLENIFLNGAILGMSKAEIKSKLDQIVEFSGVARYLDTPVKRYSSGMKVRLGFAVAAHLEPEILIVDEVLAVGDAEFQNKCIGKMRHVSGEGRTVLFVSHNMAAVKSLCNRGIILESGVITFNGNVDEACNEYQSRAFANVDQSIAERTDRKGNGQIRIQDLYFVSKNNARVNTLLSGEAAKIRIAYKKYSSKEFENIFVGIVIKNAFDMVSTVFATDEIGVKFKIDEEEGYFEINISPLLLRAGTYTVSYMLSSKASHVAEHFVFDNMQNATTFVVERGDYWQTGNLNRVNGYLQDFTIKKHTDVHHT